MAEALSTILEFAPKTSLACVTVCYRWESGIREFGTWRYLMCPAPDEILIELFEIEAASMPPELARYFDDVSSN